MFGRSPCAYWRILGRVGAYVIVSSIQHARKKPYIILGVDSSAVITSRNRRNIRESGVNAREMFREELNDACVAFVCQDDNAISIRLSIRVDDRVLREHFQPVKLRHAGGHT